MAKTLKALGIVRYLDEVYGAEGGYSRFRDTTSKWRQELAAEEYGISRGTLNTWLKLMREEESK